MQTTLDLDAAALSAALEVTPGRSEAEVVNEALREYARRRHRQGLLAFEGTMPWEGDLDQLRKREPRRP